MGTPRRGQAKTRHEDKCEAGDSRVGWAGGLDSPWSSPDDD